MIRDFLDQQFGNPDALLALLAKYSNSSLPTRPAVVKWFSRGSVPGEWLFVLLIVLYRENGRWPDLTTYEGYNDLFA